MRQLWCVCVLAWICNVWEISYISYRTFKNIVAFGQYHENINACVKIKISDIILECVNDLNAKLPTLLPYDFVKRKQLQEFKAKRNV